MEIELRTYKEIPLKNATVIDGFPGVGMIGTIVSSYLIATFNLDQIVALDSEWFPPISTIFASKPKFPARIHAGLNPKIAVFTAEFAPIPALDRAIAKTIFNWSQRQGCSLIITTHGLPSKGEEVEPIVYAVGSTDTARRRISKAEICSLEMGLVTGVPGVLLNEGRWAGLDVIALVVEVRPEIPDHRAAAKVLECMGSLAGFTVDVEPLLVEAERIETRLKGLKEQVQPLHEKVMPGIYR